MDSQLYLWDYGCQRSYAKVKPAHYFEQDIDFSSDGATAEALGNVIPCSFPSDDYI